MAALIAAAILWAYWDGITDYIGDQHYQEHFAYLWCFVALTLWHSLKGPFRSRLELGKKRDLMGLGLVVIASLLLWVSMVTGSSTATRSSLVGMLTGLALLAVPSWSVIRCLMHGALLQLCFGIPYSFYFPLTQKLRWGVSSIVGLPGELGWANYQMDGAIIRFPHYDLEVTADCSGIGQLLTFAGIAALGILSSASSGRRTVAILSLAILLAWLSNVVRVAVFALCVGLGWTAPVDNESLHSFVGFLVFLPFVAGLVAALIKTHRPLEPNSAVIAAGGRWHIGLLVLPLLLIRGFATPSVDPLTEPSYFSALNAPPGHKLVTRSQTEDYDKTVYDTPWLISARFERPDHAFFDLFHYETRSTSHLCVHQVANCLEQPGQTIRYAPAVKIDGKRWWRISLDRDDANMSWHAYFAFVIEGERRDDSLTSQLAALTARAFRDTWDVQLTRVMFTGPLPDTPNSYEKDVLKWLGRTTAGPDSPR